MKKILFGSKNCICHFFSQASYQSSLLWGSYNSLDFFLGGIHTLALPLLTERLLWVFLRGLIPHLLFTVGPEMKRWSAFLTGCFSLKTTDCATSLLSSKLRTYNFSLGWTVLRISQMQDAGDSPFLQRQCCAGRRKQHRGVTLDGNGYLQNAILTASHLPLRAFSYLNQTSKVLSWKDIKTVPAGNVDVR